MWRNQHLPAGLDIELAAGTAVVWNNTSVHAGTVRQTARPRRLLALTFDASRELARRGYDRGGLGAWCFPKRLLRAHPHLFSHIDVERHPDEPPAGWEETNGNTTRPPSAPVAQPRL
jgi:ectoine hydroxylase-related dioxygenase (phytanoyl-CoA dioxygenase family)